MVSSIIAEKYKDQKLASVEIADGIYTRLDKLVKIFAFVVGSPLLIWAGLGWKANWDMITQADTSKQEVIQQAKHADATMTTQLAMSQAAIDAQSTAASQGIATQATNASVSIEQQAKIATDSITDQVRGVLSSGEAAQGEIAEIMALVRANAASNAANAAEISALQQTVTGIQGQLNLVGVMAQHRLYLDRYAGEDYELKQIVAATILLESGGAVNATGNGGQSVGPFQLTDQGIGAGLTPEQRRNPDVVYERMVPLFARSLAQGRASGLEGENLAVYTYLQTMRPADFTNSNGAAAQRFRRAWQTITSNP
jgi:hypothetical protein